MLMVVMVVVILLWMVAVVLLVTMTMICYCSPESDSVSLRQGFRRSHLFSLVEKFHLLFLRTGNRFAY